MRTRTQRGGGPLYAAGSVVRCIPRCRCNMRASTAAARGCCTLCAASCTNVACCTVHVVRCMVHIACCILQVVRSLLCKRRMLSVACCALHVVCCMLYDACCTVMLSVARPHLAPARVDARDTEADRQRPSHRADQRRERFAWKDPLCPTGVGPVQSPASGRCKARRWAGATPGVCCHLPETLRFASRTRARAQHGALSHLSARGCAPVGLGRRAAGRNAAV